MNRARSHNFEPLLFRSTLSDLLAKRALKDKRASHQVFSSSEKIDDLEPLSEGDPASHHPPGKRDKKIQILPIASFFNALH